MARVDRGSIEQRPEPGLLGGQPAQTIIFASSGEYWTLGYAGSIFTLKDVKGLSYIQRLLQHPSEEFHSLDLLNGPGVAMPPAGDEKSSVRLEGIDSVGGLGDAGEMLDTQAKLEYKRRVAYLNEQLEELRERGDHERAEQVESEIDFLRRELARALGLGGRVRRAGSVAERARLNVTRAIRAALQKISERNAPFGEFLDRSIRTGSFCSYVRDASASVNFRFSVERGADFAPEETAPILLRRETVLLQTATRQTSFVGRQAEREILRSCLEPALHGEGRVMMISGAPGVGKSRIAAEFAAEASSRGMLALAGSCYDRDDSVPFIPFVEILEMALAQASSPDVFRRALGNNAAEMSRLMPQLRQMFPDIPAPLEISPEQSRRVLFNAVLELLARAARNTPLVLLLEDIHWADEGTLSLLSHLARSIPKLPVIIVGTYRDTEVDPGKPLAKTFDELIRLHVVERITLHGLPQNAVAEMIRALSGRDPQDALVTLIYSSTEGNPFFVEELFWHLIERGQLTDSNGEFRQDLRLPEINMPQSLRLVIGRRLARLGDETQTILGFAAVIGRSFTFELLEASTGEDAEELLDCIEGAERTGLISAGLDYPDPRFGFSHELVRQAVLEGLSLPRRQRVHLRIANAIERLYPERIADHANELAYHMLQAGAVADPGKTVQYLAMAARREISQSAYGSALRHLESALELVPKLPEPREKRERTELDLLIDYGETLLVLKGWYVPEMGDVYKRARELCRQLGETERLLSVLFGLSSFHLCRAELRLARRCADEMASLTSVSHADKMLLTGWPMGSAQFFTGDFAGAHASFDQGARFYDRQKHRGMAFLVGQDPCASCLVFDAMTLLILGYPDQAEKRLAESLVLARELGYPFTLVVCLTLSAKYYCIRREYARLPEVVQEATALAKEHGFTFYEEGITAYHIIGLAAEGKFEELKASLSRSKRFSEIRYELALTWARSTLAEALANLGRVKTALPLLNEAGEMMKRNDERYVESEIHRIRGVLALKQIEGREYTALELQSVRVEAGRAFREAKETARRQGAKLFELRAATSLSRLLLNTGRADEARRTLSEIYESFTEGFDAPDLKAARIILKDLSSAGREA